MERGAKKKRERETTEATEERAVVDETVLGMPAGAPSMERIEPVVR